MGVDPSLNYSTYHLKGPLRPENEGEAGHKMPRIRQTLKPDVWVHVGSEGQEEFGSSMGAQQREDRKEPSQFLAQGQRGESSSFRC